MFLLSKSMRGLKEVGHSLMSWSLRSLIMCLVFIAVNAENLASHRYVVENGNNIDQPMSERSGCTVAALRQRIGRLLSENFPFTFSFYTILYLSVVLHLRQTE